MFRILTAAIGSFRYRRGDNRFCWVHIRDAIIPSRTYHPAKLGGVGGSKTPEINVPTMACVMETKKRRVSQQLFLLREKIFVMATHGPVVSGSDLSGHLDAVHCVRRAGA